MQVLKLLIQRLAIGPLLLSLGCSTGETPTPVQALASYPRLSESSESDRVMFDRGATAGGNIAVVRIERVSPIRGGYREQGPDGHVVILPNGSEIEVSVLAQESSMDQHTRITFRVPGSQTCGESESEPGRHICFDYGFLPPQVRVGETWQLLIARQGGINDGYYTFMAGRRLADRTDPQLAMQDLQQYLSRRR